MTISCHFQDCEALLTTSSSYVRSGIAGTGLYLHFTFLPFQSQMLKRCASYHWAKSHSSLKPWNDDIRHYTSFHGSFWIFNRQQFCPDVCPGHPPGHFSAWHGSFKLWLHILKIHWKRQYTVHIDNNTNIHIHQGIKKLHKLCLTTAKDPRQTNFHQPRK